MYCYAFSVTDKGFSFKVTQSKSKTNCIQIHNNPQKLDPKFDPKKTLCKFYANGSCKYKHECRFDHPKMCNKFIKNGLLKKFNPAGCDAKCNKFHPNACRDSLRSKECARDNCRFFHLKGTTLLIKTREQKDETRYSQHQNQKSAPQSQSQVKFGKKVEDEDKKEKSVFQDTQMEILNAIKKLGSRIDKLETRNVKDQKAYSQRYRTSRSDWRKSDTEEDW